MEYPLNPNLIDAFAGCISSTVEENCIPDRDTGKQLLKVIQKKGLDAFVINTKVASENLSFSGKGFS